MKSLKNQVQAKKDAKADKDKEKQSAKELDEVNLDEIDILPKTNSMTPNQIP